MNRGQKPQRPRSHSIAHVTAAVMATVEHATNTARRLNTFGGGLSRFAAFSANAMYFPISRTGW